MSKNVGNSYRSQDNCTDDKSWRIWRLFRDITSMEKILGSDGGVVHWWYVGTIVETPEEKYSLEMKDPSLL